MTGFEPRSSGIGSDQSANCATNTALKLHLSFKWSIQDEKYHTKVGKRRKTYKAKVQLWQVHVYAFKKHITLLIKWTLSINYDSCGPKNKIIKVVE